MHRKTIRIPSTNFPMKANLVENEKKFKSFWLENKIWEKLCTKNSSKEYILHDGPPYANGNIHLGHSLNKILKDFVLRYKALQGYKLNYLPGWDTHGLPIENKVEQSYKNKDNLEKRKICKEYALNQIENQKQQFNRLNLLSNFQNIYKTMDKEFIDNELCIFLHLFENNLIYWGLKPIAWSWSSKTALAESEIIYKEIETVSIYTWFPTITENKKIPKNTRLLIWTTTPYTIEANLAIAVHPELTYELINNQGNLFLILENWQEKLDLQGEIVEKIVGKELEGYEYLNPCTNEINKVICADYISKTTGTGLVHNAPGFGLEDYDAAHKYGIKIYSAIQDDGTFNNSPKFKELSGKFYEDASKILIDWLEKQGYLFKKEIIKHNVGHDWRTEKPIIYRASPQWFINIEKLKEQINNIKNVDSYPQWLFPKLQKLISNRKEWCLSRQRIWGTPIPILFDGNKPILTINQIQHTIELLKKYGIETWFTETPEFFLHPNTKIRHKLKKGEDILDVWFDSGCSWNVLENKQADLYLEGFDQLRGWFNSSAIISLAKNAQIPFKQLVSHGFVLDQFGNKMSKSKGNVIDPIEIVDKYGTDILRLWIGTNNYMEDIRMSNEGLTHTISIYKKIRNTLFRYSLSVIPKEWDEEALLKNLKYPENIYIFHKFQEHFKQIKTYLDHFLFFRAVKENLDFLNIYSGWYLEICKDVLYCDDKNSDEYKETISIIKKIFKQHLIFYSIFIPQTAEEAYAYLDNKEKESVCLETWNNEFINYQIDEDKWNKFFKLKNHVYFLIEELKKQKEIKSSVDATIIIPKADMIEDLNLLKCLNVAEIIEGNKIEAKKCQFKKCERCHRCFKNLNEQLICVRCKKIVRNYINSGN